MSAIIVSFFGGPCSGKSTLASGVFHMLKRNGTICEFVHEYAKELTWEGRHGTLSNQTFILGQQYEMMRRCMEQVDVIITDTSLLNSAIYCHNYDLPYAKEIENLAVAMFESMNNKVFFVKRINDYSSVGRYQDKDSAYLIDDQIINMLNAYGIIHRQVWGSDSGKQEVYEDILQCLNQTQSG